jgi:viroplasmin and RNaseH domain-containing protein
MKSKVVKNIVVFNGPKPNVYDNWEKAKSYAKGYDIIYQGYERRAEADKAFADGLDVYLEKRRRDREKSIEKDKGGPALF